MNEDQILLGFKQGKNSAEDVYEFFANRKKASTSCFPLTEGQTGIWMSQNFDPSNSMFNVPICFRVREAVDIDLLRKAFSDSLKIHSLLNNVIKEIDGVPFLVENSAARLNFQVTEITETELHSRISEAVEKPFSLTDDPLCRLTVFRISPNDYVVLIVIHHIVFDGASIPRYLNSLLENYATRYSEPESNAIDRGTDYHNFVEWEQQYLDSSEGDDAKFYWEKVLEGHSDNLSLSVEKTGTGKRQSQSRLKKIKLSTDLAFSIRQFCKSEGVNPSVFFLALYKLLISHYSGRKDIVVGMPTMGRPMLEHDDLVGYFVNMLPIRSEINSAATLKTFIHHLELIMAGAIDHADYPFPRMVRDKGEIFDLGVHPIFQIAYVFQNRSLLQLDSIIRNSSAFQAIEFMEDVRQGGEFKLQLEIFEDHDDYSIELKYASEIFSEADMQELLSQYENLLSSALNEPDKSISDYSLLSDVARDQILNDWNTPALDVEESSSLDLVFAEQVQAYADQTAIEASDIEITYGELNSSADSVAGRLYELGVRAGDTVGICVHHSPELIALILGTIKAGATYVPIDPRNPESRIQYVIDDSRLRVLIIDEELQSSLNLEVENLLHVNGGVATGTGIFSEHIDRKPVGNSNQAKSTAYICYTSGTEGCPKGVVVTHANVLRLVRNTNYVPLSQQSRVLMHSPSSFDATTFELWAPLLNGGCIAVSEGGLNDPSRLLDLLSEHKVNTLFLTSGLFSLYAEQIGELPTVDYVLTGGDVVSPGSVKRVYEKNPGITVLNVYGPTENTTFSTFFEIPRDFDFDTSLPIGKPISQTTAYILGDNLELLPAGVVGELCLGGVGVAQGYLNNESLSEHRFVDDPFEKNRNGKIYRSGDKARWLPDGNIEYIGRNDRQVKVRGFRVELGEIENVLHSHDDVKSCAVEIDIDAAGDKYLTAYIAIVETRDSARERDVSDEINSYLRNTLPDYLQPDVIHILNKLPLTINGKIDRSALSELSQNYKKNDSQIAVFTPRQEDLSKIWSEILDIDLEFAGAGTNFFEIGGHSLSLTRVASRINSKYSIELTIKDLVEHPTLQDLAAFIDSILEEKEFEAIPQMLEKIRSIKGMTDESLEKFLEHEAS